MIDLCICDLYVDEQGSYYSKEGDNLYRVITAVCHQRPTGRVEKLYSPEVRRCTRDKLNQIIASCKGGECTPDFDHLWLCRDGDVWIACDNLRDRALIEEFSDETSAILWLRDDRLSWEDMP